MTDASKVGKIFIGGLSYETTDEKLRSYFGAFGNVTDAVVMKDPISRRSRGFGFITYTDPACVDRALAQPNHILDSRRVEAKRAVPRSESGRDSILTSSSSLNGNSTSSNTSNSVGGTNSGGGVRVSNSNTSSSGPGSSGPVIATKKIFVGGLHYETKDADFKKYFEQFGRVLSAEVMFNRETNKSRGFGFVVFEVESSVDHVLQNRNHTIDGKSVEVKRAVPRTDGPPSRLTTPVSSTTSSVASSSVPQQQQRVVASSSSGATAAVRSSDKPSVAAVASDSNTARAASEAPRSFAAVASGNFKGYAAAVRFGGKGAAPTSSQQSTPQLNSIASPRNGPEDGSLSLQNMKLEDEGASVAQDTSIDSASGSFVSQSPRNPAASVTSPVSQGLSLDSNSQWATSGFQNSVSSSQQQSYNQQPAAPGSDQSSTFSWHQQPQWQQWSQHGLQDAGLDQNAGTAPSQHQPPPAATGPPPGVPQPPQQPQSSSYFSSMFGPPIGDGSSQAAGLGSDYNPPWNGGGVYGGASAGMGHLGGGIGGMGSIESLGMGDAAAAAGHSGGFDHSHGYGSGFSGGFGGLHGAGMGSAFGSGPAGLGGGQLVGGASTDDNHNTNSSTVSNDKTAASNSTTAPGGFQQQQY